MTTNFFHKEFKLEMTDNYMSHLQINLKIGFSTLLELSWLYIPMMHHLLETSHLSILIDNILLYLQVNA